MGHNFYDNLFLIFMNFSTRKWQISMFSMRKWQKPKIKQFATADLQSQCPVLGIALICKKQYQTLGYIPVGFLDPTCSGSRAVTASFIGGGETLGGGSSALKTFLKLFTPIFHKFVGRTLNVLHFSEDRTLKS